MIIVIRKALIVDPHSPTHLSIKDILVKDGFIAEIGDSLPGDKATVIEQDGLMVSPGWIDIFSDFSDPGFEQKESITTGVMAAASGGYTQVCVVPNTAPPIDTKAQVEYIVQKSRELAVTVHPLGALSKGCQGKELSEMYDMKGHGAVAFTD